MVRLKIHPIADAGRHGLPADGPGYAGLGAAEYRELVTAGVWAESGAGNWTRVAPDGSVWAGGAAGKVAKVRGKNGRKLGRGRTHLPPEQRRRTYSVQLSAIARANLERQAAEETARTGHKVTVSMLLERMARELGQAG